jgi:hypothetical protein
MNEIRCRPFYAEYAWAFDLLIDRPVEKRVGLKRHVKPAAAPRSVEHAALGAPVRRTPARPQPP